MSDTANQEVKQEENSDVVNGVENSDEQVPHSEENGAEAATDDTALLDNADDEMGMPEGFVEGDEFDVEGNPDEEGMEQLDTEEANTASEAAADQSSAKDASQSSEVGSTSTNDKAADSAATTKAASAAPKTSPQKPAATGTQPKAATSSATPSKGEKSGLNGDDSFVVQVDDTVLNDIDSDLLDPSQAGDGKASESASGDSGGTKEQSEDKKEATEADGEGTTAAGTDSSNKTAASKDEKDGETAAKSGPANPAKKEEKATISSRNLWVSGLSSSTRATDLKALFSKNGKVIGAKVVTNARAPGSRCYGFVTMGSADEATKCIQHLHRTELHGRMISVERAKTEPQGSKGGAKVLPPSGLKSPPKAGGRPPRKSEGEKKEGAEGKDGARPERSDRSRDRSRSHLSEKARKELSFEKIKAERERMRLKNKELYLRNVERRRVQSMEHKQRMMEKRMTEESMEIEREKRRLARMREELEHERIETERLKLETERLRIQKERELYRREQERVLQDRKPVKRPVERRDDEWGASKRPATDRFPPEPRGAPRYGAKSDRFERADERPAARFEGAARREPRPGRHERFEERAERPVGRGVREREYPAARREEHRPAYREERPRGEPRPGREERLAASRESTHSRGAPRHEARSEWKSDRVEPRAAGKSTGTWNGPVVVARSKADSGWSQAGRSSGGHHVAGDVAWDGGHQVVKMSSQSGGYAVQQGSMVATGMGQPVFIAQPAGMAGGPVLVQGSVRQGGGGGGRYTVAAGATLRRY